MLRSRQFTMRCRRFRELCVGQAGQVCEKSGQWRWPGELDASSRQGKGLATCALMARPLRCTRFSSRDARRNLTQAAKSGVRLLFLRCRDRRASKTPALCAFVNGAACSPHATGPKSFLFALRSIIVGVFCVHAACTRLTWTLNTHLVDYLTEPTPASRSGQQ